MTKKERQAAIIQLLQERGEVQIQTICRQFHIVAMTARRDLSELEAAGVLIRTHGGAIALEKKTFDTATPLAARIRTHTEEKEQMATYARTLLQPHDAIFIASGSTIDIFARSLLHKIPLSIVTDAVNVAYELYQDSNLHIYMVGGELRSNSLTLTGSIAQNNLKQFRLQKAFISVNGIDEAGNLYTSSVVESGLLEDLFRNVEEIYVLADSSKLGRKDFVSIPTQHTFTLITGAGANEQILEHYRSLGINVHIAS